MLFGSLFFHLPFIGLRHFTMTSMQQQLTPSKVGPRGADPATAVYYKLAFFSLAIFVAPLTAYYFSVDRFFGGNPNYAGGLAALVANVVLIAYVITAFLEDQGSDSALKKEATREELQARLKQMDAEEERKKDR